MTTKQANPAAIAADNAALRGAALDDILAVAGLAAAGGVGARGLLGLRYLLGRRKPNLQRALGPTVVSVPAPVYASPAAAAAGHKAAGYALYKQAIEKRAEGLLTSRSEIPWYLPGITLGAVGGLAGGYKLMDYLMDRKRKADLQADLEDARADYRAALLSQYDPAAVPGPGEGPPDIPPPARTVNPQPGAAKPLPLRAATMKSAELQADLDALAAGAEKVAAEKAAMPGWAGRGLGIYATLASLLALGSGAAAYNFTRSRSSSQLVEKALKDRERDRWNRRPPEIYAVPQPVRVRHGDVTPAGTMQALPGAGG